MSYSLYNTSKCKFYYPYYESRIDIIYLDIMTRENQQSKYVATLVLIYWLVLCSSRRRGGWEVSLYKSAGRKILSEQAKIWCNIQVIIYPQTTASSPCSPSLEAKITTVLTTAVLTTACSPCSPTLEAKITTVFPMLTLYTLLQQLWFSIASSQQLAAHAALPQKQR